MGQGKKVRYAVVGLGHIAQVAVLPAFAHASKNSILTALVSGNQNKLRQLARRYGLSRTYTYDQYDACLESGEVDAVYIALPNDMHCNFTLRAARAGVHVLCEKPLASTVEECRKIEQAARRHKIKVMTAYRLHFEEANLRAIELVRSGKLGEPRIFNSVFTMQVTDPNNIRLKRRRGGGTLFDIGVYCINAARYIFRAEPLQVFAFSANNGEKRFREIDEMTSAVLRFPGDRLASFTCSFGAADVASFQVVGTKGTLELSPAYEYAEGLEQVLKLGDKEEKKYYPKRDQFAPELIAFSDAILKKKEIEPSALEGLIDVQIVTALYESARTGRPVRLRIEKAKRRPSLKQMITCPPVRKPEVIQSRSPHPE